MGGDLTGAELTVVPVPHGHVAARVVHADVGGLGDDALVVEADLGPGTPVGGHLLVADVGGDILLGLDDVRRVAGDETLTGAPEMLDPKRSVDAGGGVAGAPPVCAHNLDEAARFGGSWRVIGWFPAFGANHDGNRGALWLALYADAAQARRVFDAYVGMVEACAATGRIAYPGSVKCQRSRFSPGLRGFPSTNSSPAVT